MIKILTEKEFEDIITQALNIRLPQNFISDISLTNCPNLLASYCLPKKLVCVANKVAASAEIHANAVSPVGGLFDILVARLRADRALLLSKILFSVNPAVRLSKNNFLINHKTG